MIKKIKLTKDQRKRIARIETALSIIVFISLPLCFILSAGVENYPQWFLFILILITVGIIIGVILSRMLHHFIPETITYKNAKGFKLSHPIFFSSILISIGTGLFLNGHWTRFQECKTFKIHSFGSSGSHPKAHYVFIQKGNGKERLLFGSAFNEAYQGRDSIQLSLITGCLGFTYYKPKCP